MSKWLNKFLHDTGQNRSDKPDITDKEFYLSGLSGPPGGLFGKNLGNMSGTLSDKPDNTDRFSPDTNVSVLSVPPHGALDKTSLLDDFEERLAISEYDGQQSPLQDQRIAYQDAFIAVLNTLPHEGEEGYYDEDWLTRRIKAAQNWLVAQGLHQPK